MNYFSPSSLWLTGCSLCLCLTAFADDQPLCTRPVSLAYYDMGLLYTPPIGGQPARGIDKDVVDELGRRTGCSFDTRLLSRALIWNLIRTGTLDMSVSGIQTPDRDAFARFVNYLSVKNYALLPARYAHWTAERFLADPTLRMGAVHTFRFGRFYDQLILKMKDQGRLDLYADTDHLYRAFQLNRVQLIIAEPIAYKYRFRQRETLSHFTVEDWAPAEPPIKAGLIFSKQNYSQEEVDKWREVIAGMRRDGTLRKIFLNYVSPAEADQMLTP